MNKTIKISNISEDQGLNSPLLNPSELNHKRVKIDTSEQISKNTDEREFPISITRKHKLSSSKHVATIKNANSTNKPNFYEASSTGSGTRDKNKIKDQKLSKKDRFKLNSKNMQSIRINKPPELDQISALNDSLKDTKIKFYYGPYNHNLHYQPFMEFDFKDMRNIVDEDGQFTNLMTKRTEWERITDFILNADRKRFDFYLTLLHLGIITQTGGSNYFENKQKGRKTSQSKNKLNISYGNLNSPTVNSTVPINIQLEKIIQNIKDAKENSDQTIRTSNTQIDFNSALRSTSQAKKVSFETNLNFVPSSIGNFKNLIKQMSQSSRKRYEKSSL